MLLKATVYLICKFVGKFMFQYFPNYFNYRKYKWLNTMQSDE